MNAWLRLMNVHVLKEKGEELRNIESFGLYYLK